MSRFVLVSLMLLGFSISLQAQKINSCHFRKVSAENFIPTRYPVGTGAAAVYLADEGNAAYSDRSGNLELVFTHYTRLPILRKSGCDKADFTIPLFNGKASGKLDALNELKAVTYNPENGRVVATKLESKIVFAERDDIGEWELKKFSMPEVKEGFM